MQKVACAFCEALDSEISFRDHGYDKRDYAIAKCKSCGFQFLTPLPTDEYLSDLYSAYYVDTSDHLRFRDPVFQSLCDMLEEKRSPGTKLLDIGCGTGDFLWLAQMRGWEVSGIELSTSAVKYATATRNLNVIQGAFDDLPYPEGSFDVVTLLDVLEHLPNPTRVLKSVYNVLKPDGIVVIQVPNTPFQILKARFQKIQKGSAITTMAAPLHVNHFDANSLSNFAKKTHFSVEKVFPGFADKAGPGLNVKKAYVWASRMLWKCSGLQAGHSLCMVAKKSPTSQHLGDDR